MRSLVCAVVLLTIGLLVGPGADPAVAASATADSPGEPAGTPAAHHFRGTPTVGALFPPGSQVHTCSASVVDSAAGDLLITAAHCISGTGDGYVFVPGYRDGAEPAGSWTVLRAYGAPEWTAHQAPQGDFAFLVVAPHRVNGHPEQIQSVTGADRLATAPSRGEQITVPAYAVGRDDDPLTCTTRVYYRATFPAFNCNPYVGGTSGAPWLHRTSAGWTVVGVIGGLHQGGCYPWTSYSAAFGAASRRAQLRAAERAPASVFPVAGSDGCSTGP